MFAAKNKVDLMIEVWEKLDCESVGSDEVVAIETALVEHFGNAAVDSPMTIARLLADEGAVLRHSEIMKLYVERNSDRPYEPAFRNILNIGELCEAAASLRRLENLRRKYTAEGDKEGLRLIREKGRAGRAEALERAKDKKRNAEDRSRYAEIAEWLTLWMQSPEMFEGWIDLRLSSADFKERFPGAL
ncbi:MAG: hypothetical protein AB7F88_06505 [Pyrinomonadaceae bacterium]